MSIESINRRLDKLDALRPAVSPRRVIRLIVEEDEETPDQAIARWCAEHPDQPPPDSAADFIILRSLVSRNGRPLRVETLLESEPTAPIDFAAPLEASHQKAGQRLPAWVLAGLERRTTALETEKKP